MARLKTSRAISYSVALKQCKQYQLIGIRGVSGQYEVIFHRLIHTCVENFTRQKYLLRFSARVMLARGEKICGC